MSWQEPLEEKETEEQEGTSLEGRVLSLGGQTAAGSAGEHEREAFSLLSFDYARLDPETREFVEQKATQTHGLLLRTAEHILAIGKNLLAVKERLGHGQFLPWLQREFGMSRHSAQHFMRVAARLESKWRNFHHLPMSVLYELAAPSTPERIVEQVERGELDPTLTAIRQAKDTQKQAEQAHLLRAQEEAQARETALMQAKQIRELTQQIEELQQQMALQEEQTREPIVIEKPVVPPEMQAHLSTLQRQVQDLSLERERLIARVEQLGAHNRAEFIERNEVARHQRVRQQWRSVTAAWEKSTRELSSHWPALLDTESFGSEEWATLHQMKEAASSMAGRCEKLVQARQMIVDSRL